MTNLNDEKRDVLLRYLYNIHENARGPAGVATKIRELWKAMKSQGIKQKEVNSNLDYLIQKGWIVIIEEKKTFTTQQGTKRESPSKTYKISGIGIDRLEKASTYQREEHYSNINITNINGVTVVGTNNIVNTQCTDLADVLSKIEKEIQTSTSLSETDKLNTIADIGTIQMQLSKPKPDKAIIQKAWSILKNIVGTTSFFMQSSTLIEPFISG